MSQFNNLFQFGRIGPVDLASRAVVAPMTRVSSGPGNVPTEQMQRHYRAFADGGFPLIISEGVYTDDRQAMGYLHQPGNINDEQQAGWAKVIETVHGGGAKFFMQVMHAGALSQHSDYADETRSSSSYQPPGEMSKNYFGDGPYRPTKALTLDEIEAVKAAFADTAKRSVAAGADGIEIHGANGYLLHQFFSHTVNQRDDQYGGSPDNRARFHAEVLKSVKAAVGPYFPVGMRLSEMAVNTFANEWDGINDAKALFSALADAGADYIHLNSVPAQKPVLGTDRPLAAIARDYYSGPVMACGGFTDPAVADQFIADGHADFIAMARGALADPAWPTKVQAGETPQEFDPGMTMPIATLDNTEAWRAANS